jgi:hypothetical protein
VVLTHVWKGRRECGMCLRNEIEQDNPPPEHTIEDMYRKMFNEHNKRLWDVQNGFVEVWDQGDTVLAMMPGCTMSGSGDHARSVSIWGSTKGIRKRESKSDGDIYLHGTDGYERVMVSNNTGIIGGLTDRSVMRDILYDVSRQGTIYGFVPKLQEWRDQDKNRRLSWGHPCYVLFQHEAGLENSMQSFRQDNQRPDGGGQRTLKIEWSTGELMMPTDENGEAIEKGSDKVGTRFDPGLSDIRDTFCANMICRFDGLDFDVMGTPANDWPCNAGKSVRKFAGGKRGDAADEFEVDACE